MTSTQWFYVKLFAFIDRRQINSKNFHILPLHRIDMNWMFVTLRSIFTIWKYTKTYNSLCNRIMMPFSFDILLINCFKNNETVNNGIFAIVPLETYMNIRMINLEPSCILIYCKTILSVFICFHIQLHINTVGNLVMLWSWRNSWLLCTELGAELCRQWN